MKRFLAISAALLMTLSLAACSNNKVNNNAPSSSGAASSGQTSEPNANQPGNATGTADVKTGLGTVISLEGSRGATDTTPASAQAEITVCAASFDADGTIIGVMFDVAEAGIDYDVNGALTTDLGEEVKTKRQLGDDYGMAAVSGIGKEWYEQVDSLQEWMIGKTAEEVLGMRTGTADNDITDNNSNITDDNAANDNTDNNNPNAKNNNNADDTTGNTVIDNADLKSSVTIDITAFLDALQKAYDNAK